MVKSICLVLLIALVAYSIAYEKNLPGSWTSGLKSPESSRKLGDYSSGYDSSLHDSQTHDQVGHGHSGEHFNSGVYGAESHGATGFKTGGHYAGAHGTTGYNTGAHYAGAHGTTGYNTGTHKAGLQTGYDNSANKYGHLGTGLHTSVKHNTAYDSKSHDTGAYNPKTHGTAYGAHPSVKEHIPFSNQKSEYTYK